MIGHFSYSAGLTSGTGWRWLTSGPWRRRPRGSWTRRGPRGRSEAPPPWRSEASHWSRVITWLEFWLLIGPWGPYWKLWCDNIVFFCFKCDDLCKWDELCYVENHNGYFRSWYLKSFMTKIIKYISELLNLCFLSSYCHFHDDETQWWCLLLPLR